MTPEGLALIKSEEGFRGFPYRDVAGILTVGYGTTFPLTDEEATMLLDARADGWRKIIIEWTQPTKLTDHQIDALLSLTYEIGLQAFHHSTVLRDIVEGKLSDVPDGFRMWKYAGGRIQPGMVARREHELTLWETP